MNTPAPPAAAVIIRLAREAAGIRVADAAAKAGISVARWSQIENGHETRQGEIRPARAKSATLARMAAAVGVSSARMEAEGCDPEAAAIMREIERQARPAPPPLLPVIAKSAREAGVDPFDPLDPWTRPIREQVRVARNIHGDSPTGSQIFHGTPASSYEAGVWDDLSLDEESRIIGIAIIRAYRARDEAGRNPSRSGRAGLTPALTLARR